ncbi:MAG: class I SAM-dependent methyltransferase [Bifidobacteriaceae bacterium]|jgi:demethylmenaquinone methyltransferase/2-methoxy-6-polyprenyl-1,4-benzoquinol methylase|nr:class I SAM-dependent methyltransferase [Bifidobacteriaceae bacterium]
MRVWHTVTAADLAKEPRTVASMFDTVAPHYDLADAIMTAGLVRWWRRRMARLVAPRPGERILDLAAGTGTSSLDLAKSGAQVVACDFSEGMLRQGGRRLGHWRDRVSLVGGDAACLPFADDTFDKVTISFGLRNVQDVPGALAEMRRVTKPGGALIVCEFSRPVWRPFRAVYRWYLTSIMPAVAKLVATNSPAYRYLAESIWAWADQHELERQLELAGWREAKHTNVMGGIVALHAATAP